MEQRPFGPHGASIPIVGQGTWYIAQGDRANAIAALRRGLDLGLTHIDTAEMYEGAEALVGEAIAGRRDEVFLVSKVVPEHASLRRLRTDHLDAYLLHWPGRHPLEDTFAAFEQLQAAGKIRAWGSATSTRTTWTTRGPSRGRARSPAIRCSITWASARSSTRSSPGARRTTWRSSPTARSGMATSRADRGRARSRCCRGMTDWE